MPDTCGTAPGHDERENAGVADEVAARRADWRSVFAATTDDEIIKPRLVMEVRLSTGPHTLSTNTTRTSFTFVNVGPVSNRSPVAAKNPVASLFARYAAAS